MRAKSERKNQWQCGVEYADVFSTRGGIKRGSTFVANHQNASDKKVSSHDGTLNERNNK